MPLLKYFTPIILFLPFVLHAQQDIDTYFASVRSQQAGTRFSAPVKNEALHLRRLVAYSADTSTTVRAEAYYLLANLALTAQKEATAKEAVRYLLQGWRDADMGINNQVAQYLTTITARYFDHIALDSIESYMHTLPAYPGELFRIVSNLQLAGQIPALKTYATQPQLSAHARWQAYTALARLGDQQAVDFMLNRVRAMGVNDDVVYELFPDLVYTRSFRAIRYLEEVLMNDDKRCDPPSGDSRSKITCAYRVMEQLAPAIKDYPLTRSASGDIAEKDYPQALDRVRAWFKEKDGTYEIIRHTF